jgi:hypothetical protein
MSNDVNNEETQEVYNNILSITRDQLSKSMGLSTELEALLLLERRKTSELEAKVAELEEALENKNK